MTGSCWRLLAAFVLIFASTFLLGQDAAEGPRSLAPNRGAIPYYSAPIGRDWRPVSPRLPRRNPVSSETFAFEQMVRAAGIIFSGRVTSIGRATNFSGQDSPSTTVTFQVEQAIRGTSAGQKLTIREWAGLWTFGEHYRVGERWLLFLYAPSKLGLTSPVSGAMGRFAMDSRGMVVMNPQHAATLAGDPILGGKTVVSYADFALAVRRSRPEE